MPINLPTHPIERKNIGLARLLYDLRQDLDVHCLLGVNAKKLKRPTVGWAFFGRIHQLVLQSIALNISKVYEFENYDYEKQSGYQLNSILGVCRSLSCHAPTTLHDVALKKFIKKYKGASGMQSGISALESTVNKFRDKHRSHLERFREFRNKKVAHSEYDITITSLPSYTVMETLFVFGADFCELISSWDLGERRTVKASLKRLLEKIGIADVKMDMD